MSLSNRWITCFTVTPRDRKRSSVISPDRMDLRKFNHDFGVLPARHEVSEKVK